MIKKIQKAIAASKVDAIILSGEINRRYATGFHSTAGVCYISPKLACFFTDFRYVEAAKATAQNCDVHELTAGKTYCTEINGCIRADRAKRVALEDNSLTYAEYRRWENSLTVETQPLGELLDDLREVKTPDEVACIIRAQRIAERALAETLNDIKAGVTEKEIAARLTYLMLLYGAENMSFDPIVVAGKHSSLPHGVPTNQPIAQGDFVTMDIGCIVDGYCSDMTRTVAVGHCTDEMRTVYEVVLRAQEAGIAAARAGVCGSAVDSAARAVIAEAGYGDAFGHGFGHGVGLEIHEAPNVSPRTKRALAAQTIVTAEPGIYLADKFGVRIEDMLQITAHGCVNLTEAPKELLIL